MILEKDWIFESDEYICHVRTAGVLIKDDKIFVQRDKDGNEYSLPGGHIKIGETLEDGLIREYKEETAVDIRCKRLLWSQENFWKWKGKFAHNISFIFLIEECEGSETPDIGEFVSLKDNCDVLIGWLPVEEIKNVVIYPEFLKEEIDNLNGPMKHFISKG